MAGDWIKMRHDLQDDPAVIGMAADLSTNEFMVIGMLHRWWSWLDRQSRDGHALNVTSAWLDRYIGVTGFAYSLQSHGWLQGRDGQYNVPNFDRHNGKPSKNRALSAQRKSRQRSRNSHADSHAQTVTREEKRRVSPPTPSPGVSGDKGRHEEKTKPGAWWLSEATTNAYGASLGLPARPGEPMDAYRARLRQAKHPEAA